MIWNEVWLCPSRKKGDDETWTSGSHEVSQADQAKRACLR
jgi:hypothetical protein